MSYMYEQAKKRNEEIKEAFGDSLTLRQIWVILKIARNIALYCRSGIARDNYLNAAFDGIAKFSRVIKQREGKEYKGVKINYLGQDHEEVDD